MTVRIVIAAVIILGILALTIWSTNQTLKKKEKSRLLYKKFECLLEGAQTYSFCVDLKTMFIAECMEENLRFKTGQGNEIGRYSWKIDYAYLSDFEKLLAILNTKIDIYKFNETIDNPKPINDDEFFAKTEEWWRKHFSGCPKDSKISSGIIQDYIEFAKSDIVKNYWITKLNK
jgi:hypothetical protein